MSGGLAGQVERPPWTQELTPEETDEMLRHARAVGGDVEKWAVTVYYIQSALAEENARLRRDKERQLESANEQIHEAGRIIWLLRRALNDEELARLVDAAKTPADLLEIAERESALAV